MFWGPADDRRLEQQLRELLTKGFVLEEAIRTVRQANGIGSLLFCRAVESITKFDPYEAKRVIVKALLDLNDSQD
jgi:hypothetical protein